MGRHGLLACVCASAIAFTTVPAASQNLLDDGSILDPEAPAVVIADELVFDSEENLVIARGEVFIAQGGRLLRADEVTYDRDIDLVTASGNIVLRESTGELLFADYVELTGDLADGFVDNVAIRFGENARVIADVGYRRNGTETVIERAVYSLCDLCEEDPRQAPLWQVLAERVTHNSTTRNIEYENATLEFFGVPIAWLPYFYTPDPTVERRSGLLVPRFGSTPDLGIFGTISYYWDIAPDQDLVTNLMLTAEQSAMLSGVYRQRFEQGEITVEASINYSDVIETDTGVPVDTGEDFRGHVFARGLFALDDNWRVGFDIQETSDETYLDTFEISEDDLLESRAFAEGFFGLSYSRIEAFHFTDLRPEAVQQPIVAPLAQYNYVGEPGDAWFGGQWFLETGAMGLTREDDFVGVPTGLEDIDTYRVNATAGWQRQDITRFGLVTQSDISFSGALYYSEDLPLPGDPTLRDDESLALRGVGTVGITARYPFVRQDGNAQQLIEPVAALRATGVLDNDAFIPNNDSVALEFDEINLLSESRYPGIDRVDDGLRFTYGLQTAWYDPDGINARLFIGQSLRTDYSEEFNSGSGLEGGTSDIVGRLTVNPFEGLEVDWRFRVDDEEFDATQTDLAARFQSDWVSAGVEYLFIDSQTGTRSGEDQQELTISAAMPISEFWSASGYWRRDLEDDQSRAFGFGVRYADECFTFGFDVRRTFTDDDGTEDGTSFFVTLSLTGFGELPVRFDEDVF